MSFILDALKKSETERQRQNAPGIASIPESGQSSKGGKWIWLIVGLLVINLAVLAGIFWTRSDPPAEPVATTEAAPESPVATRAPATASGSTPAVTGQSAAPVAVPPPTETFAPPAGAGQVTTGLPTMTELQVNGQLQLPDMHLDIHVYSAQPADRFVFVNMSKYKENETLSEGPFVREITPDGVVLDFQGRQFLLPRE